METTDPSARMLRLDQRHTGVVVEREAVDLTGTSLATCVAVIETEDPELVVNVGAAAETDLPPFVNVTSLAPVTIGESVAAESFGRRQEQHQVSVFAGSLAGAVALRETLLAAFAGESGVWQLTDADLPPFEDPTVPVPAWVAPFTVRHMT